MDIPPTETPYPDAQTLSEALTIAWDLLVAAEDPAAAGERADATRRLMAQHLVRAAASSDDLVDLWMAALAPLRTRLDTKP